MHQKLKKLIIFVIILLFVIIFFYFSENIRSILDLNYIKIYRDEWINYASNNPLMLEISFFVFNVFMASLPIAGITVISFLGGALFGFTNGFLLSSIATALGNLIAFLISRYFFRDYINKKYGTKYNFLKEEFSQKGAFLLFTLRMFPFVPSFIATLLMSVTSLSAVLFFFIGWLGRVPLVIVYSWAGHELAEINSYQDILSIRLVLAFSAIALLPWLLKYIKNKI